MGSRMNGVHIPPSNPQCGHIEDGPLEHIAEAEDWLRAQGCTHARGPMGPSTWHTYRAVVETNGRSAFLGEPTAQPDAWRERGFAPIANYASALAGNLDQAEAAAERSGALVRAGWSLKGLDAHTSFDAALECLHHISSRAFTEAFAYTPLSLVDFKAMYSPIEPLIDPRMVLTAITPKGEPAGFCFTIPDRLNPDSSTFIIKTLAVDPAHRQHGLGSWMTGVSHSIAHDLGHTEGGIHALMWTGSHSNAISKHAGSVFRRYALFEKAL